MGWRLASRWHREGEEGIGMTKIFWFLWAIMVDDNRERGKENQDWLEKNLFPWSQRASTE